MATSPLVSGWSLAGPDQSALLLRLPMRDPGCHGTGDQETATVVPVLSLATDSLWSDPNLRCCSTNYNPPVHSRFSTPTQKAPKGGEKKTHPSPSSVSSFLQMLRFYCPVLCFMADLPSRLPPQEPPRLMATLRVVKQDAPVVPSDSNVQGRLENRPRRSGGASILVSQ